MTKKTVFKWQEPFWAAMKATFDAHYKEKYLAAGAPLAATARVHSAPLRPWCIVHSECIVRAQHASARSDTSRRDSSTSRPCRPSHPLLLLCV